MAGRTCLTTTISRFSFPWTPHKQAGGSVCNWGTLERLLFCMSESHYLLGSSSCYPSRWGFSPYSSLCQESGQWKLWSQVRNLADFLAGNEGDSLAHLSHCFFLLSFSSILGLEPGQKEVDLLGFREKSCFRVWAIAEGKGLGHGMWPD